MKMTMRMVVATSGMFALVGSGTVVGAQTAAPSAVEYLTKAKAVFERSCGVCHPLERPLSKTFDKGGWEKTIERMHGNGAEVSAEERAQVVTYLLTKNTFEAKCSACHGTDRPLGKNKAAADWLSTVQRMSEKKPGHLMEAEAANIAAYLSVTRPLL